MFPSGAVVEEVLRVPLSTVESMQHEILALLGNDVGVSTWLQYVQVFCDRLGSRDLVGAGLTEQQAMMAIAGRHRSAWGEGCGWLKGCDVWVVGIEC